MSPGKVNKLRHQGRICNDLAPVNVVKSNDPWDRTCEGEAQSAHPLQFCMSSRE